MDTCNAMSASNLPPSDLIETVAKCACSYYNSLPKNGKPIENQWASMAAIIVSKTVSNEDQKFKVVSLGTGTKCLGQNEISEKGDLVVDSHAEVIARRAFMCYLYGQIKKFLTNDKECILECRTTETITTGTVNNEENSVKNFSVKEGVEFHMFISHVPCGDAAIFSEDVDNAASNDEESSSSTAKKIKLAIDDKNDDRNDTDDEAVVKRQHRTGAKLEVGAVHYEERFQNAGRCRIKGGKGDPTLCMSCSDKMYKWQLMGFQGSLLGNFIKQPIRMTSITVGRGVSFNLPAFQRAIYFRFHDDLRKQHVVVNDYPEFLSAYKCPLIGQSPTVNFIHFCGTGNPASTTIVCYETKNGKLCNQVSVNGRKHGITKKNIGKSISCLDICKRNVFLLFSDLYNQQSALSYKSAKLLNCVYCKVWESVKKNIVEGWTDKPDVQLFYDTKF